VLPRECNLDSRADILCRDVSARADVICLDDSGGPCSDGDCDLGESTVGCDGDSVGCDGDSVGCDGDSVGCEGDSVGCEGDSVGCEGDSVGCEGDSGVCNTGTSGCTAFECSLGMRTLDCPVQTVTLHCLPLVSACDPLAGSECVAPTPCVIFMSGACRDTPITCDILVSLPLCPIFPGTQCAVTGAPPAAASRVGFNPNSLAGLGVMRRQLAASLNVVRRREQALAKGLAPRTKEQIELAEKILKDALRDLERHKKFAQEEANRKPPGRGRRNKPGGK
jgi:hypothetical protein